MIKKILFICICFFFFFTFWLIDKSQKSSSVNQNIKNLKLSYFEDARIKDINIDFSKKTLRHFLVLGELVDQGDFLKYNQTNSWKKVNITYDNRLFKAKIKLHGKIPDGHSNGFIYHSYSVKLKKGKTINGFRKFKLIVNKRLNKAKATIKLAQQFDLLAMQIFPIKVNFNEKKFNSEYSFIPVIDESFADKIGKGTLYFFKEVEQKNSYNELDLKSFLFNMPYFVDKKESGKNYSKFFEKKLKETLKKDYKFNPIVVEQIIQRFSNLNNSIYENKHEDVFQYFEKDYILNYLLVMLLSAENGHQHVYGNQQVAYDFATGYFYPFITWDSTIDVDKYLNKKKNVFELMKYYADDTYLPLINYLVSNVDIKEGVIFKINNFIQHLSTKNFIDKKVLSEINKKNYLEELKKNIKKIETGKFKRLISLEKEKFISDLRFQKIGYLESDTFVFNKGKHLIDKNLIFPKEIDVLIKSGTEIILKKNISLIISGNFSALGTKENPVTVKSENDKLSFGVLAVIGGSKKKVKIKYMNIFNPSEKFIDGKYLSGGLTLYNFESVNIENFEMHNAKGEDGINIKYTKKCELKNITIENSAYDAIDIDNCKVNGEKIFIKNFSNNDKNGDGLDFYYSNAVLKNIEISGFKDKGVSIGENSSLKIYNSNIFDNRIGLAVKDDSCLFLNGENKFNNNDFDISIYKKKNNYGSGTLINNSMKNNLIIKKDDKAKIIENFDEYKCF
jgi:hypothetical protein